MHRRRSASIWKFVSNGARTIMNRLLSVVRSMIDKIIELSRAVVTEARYGESNR